MTATRSRTGASSETAATAVAAPEAAAESSGSGSAAGKAKAKAKKVGAGGKLNGGANANGKAKANPARAKAKMQARKAKAAGEQGGDAAAAPAPGKAGSKQQLIRDSFTIPKNEYHALDQLKKRAMGLEHEVRKGELLRAGIQALSAMSDPAFLAALKAVPTLKTGRPRRDKAAADAGDSSED